MRLSVSSECQQQRKEVASAGGEREKNATQLLTPYELLSSGLGSSSTSSVAVREPQQELNEEGKEGTASEAEVDQMVNSCPCLCACGTKFRVRL